LKLRVVPFILGVFSVLLGSFWALVPLISAQSPQASREWTLYNQILLIGIAVGIVVFGLMFYAIIRYREKPQKAGAS
jgi:heme/copper-type cytochrome/quinol oxidase subunit 2